MGYLLQPLLRIRLMREDRAAGELTAARQSRAGTVWSAASALVVVSFWR